MRMRRLRRGVGTSTAVFALGTALLAPTVLTSSASWTDVEYDAGNLGALDCAPERLGTSTAAGTLLGGTLLGLDLGTLAEVRGLRVSDTGAGAMPDPASASVVPDSDAQAYQNPLVVSAAFDAINLELGELLHLPLETQLGVAGQYGRASADASSAGAAGTITQGGGIDLAAMSAPPDERPRLGTLELGRVLTQALGASLSDLVTGELSDLRLSLGAVASAASVDGCAAAWQREVHAALQRDYAVAGLDLELDSPLTGQLTGAVASTLTSIQTALTALSGDEGLLNELAGGLLGPSGLGPLLTTLGVGTPTVTLAVTPDFSAVTGLLGDTIGDDDGIVTIDLASGVIRVDLAALLGATYGQAHLNGLPPNTELLINEPVLDALLLAVGGAVDNWLEQVFERLEDALDIVRVALTLDVPLTLLGYELGRLTVSLDASLAALAAGTAVVGASFSQTAGLCSIPLVGSTLCGAVDALLSGLTPALLAGLGPLVAGILTPVVSGIVTPLVTTLGSTTAALASGIVGLLGDTLGVLFGMDGLVALLVNAQNAPDPTDADAGPEPPSWAGLPGPDWAAPASTGVHDVAALVIGVVGAAPAVQLELARSSVGSNVVTG